MQIRKKCAAKAAVFLFAAAIAGSLAGGCGIRQDDEKVEELEFTVVGEAELPDALSEQIELKKEEDFTMVYSDSDFMYIAKGYGMQETGGYSISVSDCYLTENNICFGTNLSGPAEGENVEKSPSYPFIVIKLELRDENVVFL
jgi:hypothetical protein